MSMPGGWPEEEEEEEEEKVTLSVGAGSKACEDDEDWPSRIDLRGSYVSVLHMMRQLEG